MAKEVYQVFTMNEGDSYFALVKKEHFEWVFGEIKINEALMKEIWDNNEKVREQFDGDYEIYKSFMQQKEECKNFNRALFIPPIKIEDEEASFSLYSKVQKYKEKYGLTIKEIGDYI